jgi:hypothetical protein
MALFDELHDKPWTRFGAYAVGMIVGWILFEKKCKIEFTKVSQKVLPK